MMDAVASLTEAEVRQLANAIIIFLGVVGVYKALKNVFF